ncbi:MAG: bacterioferritin-associated ferredoxin [Alteromonadaceae bacterium]|jgi:bacterioferritin-associated ferredoxin
MFVCICHGITDEAINRSIEKGSTTMTSLCRGLQVGSDCGQCVKAAKAMLDSRRIKITDITGAQWVK